ncbi:MAG: divergent polysaccharide deacetylase family protein [Candidatus Cloacimonadaceae bacterium]|jgi:polysaccharide deacetylase 2 family uncharacterized protein YibQ
MGKNSIAVLTLIAAILLFGLNACKKAEPSYDDAQELLPDSYEYSEDATGDSLSESDPAMAEKQALSDLKQFTYSWTDSKEIPPVIVIVDDFGYAGGSLLQGFADLPQEVVFAILPDLPYTAKSAQIAAETGRDAIIHIPMEAAKARTSPGERYLKTGQDEQTVKDMLDAFITQIPNAIAANNHMGSTATSNRELMTTVLNHLNDRGLYFIDSVTTGSTVGYNLAHTLGYKSIRRNLFLDVPDNTDATIAQRISDLGRFKGRQEPVVIITHCHNQSKLDALRKFLKQIDEMGVKLTSLSRYYGSLALAANH